MGQPGGLSEKRLQPGGGRGPQLPQPGGPHGGRGPQPGAGRLPRGRPVRRSLRLVRSPRLQRRSGVQHPGGGRHPHGQPGAHPVFPALRRLHRGLGWGRLHLFRHRLWTRGGHEPVRGQRHGQRGQLFPGYSHLVLYRAPRWTNYGRNDPGGVGQPAFKRDRLCRHPARHSLSLFLENGTGARLPRADQSMLWMRPWISLPTVSANQPMEGMRVRSRP